MAAQGAVLIDPIDLDDEAYGSSELEVLLYEFKADLNAYLQPVDRAVGSRAMADVIAFNEANETAVMPYFGQERMLAAQEKGSLQSAAYLEALAGNHRLSREEGIDKALASHRLDAIVGPTGRPAWLTDWINGDNHGGGCSSPAAVSGYPHVTLPAGFIHGLPVGISFFGGAYTEPTLIRLAYAFEQATLVRQPPRFLPTVTF
jgi:amidase